MPTGRLTAGVVRVGETVRRPLTPSSPFMARVLAHLETTGCAWAPRHLGVDARDRDILTFHPGEVPAKWGRFADPQLRAAASIVRQLHAVTRNSCLAPTAVVCHHDPGPNNFIFRDGLPAALIDFDMAAPGDPLEDVAYMAWSWCLSSNPLRGAFAEQAAQVRVLADAFDLTSAERERLPAHVLERLSRNIVFWSAHADCPEKTLMTLEKIHEVIAWSRREREYVRAHEVGLLQALAT